MSTELVVFDFAKFANDHGPCSFTEWVDVRIRLSGPEGQQGNCPGCSSNWDSHLIHFHLQHVRYRWFLVKETIYDCHLDGRLDNFFDSRPDGRLDGRPDGCRDGRRDGRSDGCLDGRLDGIRLLLRRLGRQKITIIPTMVRLAPCNLYRLIPLLTYY